MLDVDLCLDANVQPLQKKLAPVEREVDKQERRTLTEIKSLRADENAKDALVGELWRTLSTTRTESKVLCIKINALCACLATEHNATER